MSAREKTYVPALDVALEMLKLLRCQAMTQRELAEHFGMYRASVWRPLQKLLEYGLVIEEKQPLHVGSRREVAYYSVSKAWKGGER